MNTFILLHVPLFAVLLALVSSSNKPLRKRSRLGVCLFLIIHAGLHLWFMGNPKLVLLDEPSEGIAPVIVEQMANVITSLKREGLAVLISEQNLHFAKLVSNRAYIIEKGEVKFQGTFEDLEAQPDVRQRYLAL